MGVKQNTITALLIRSATPSTVQVGTILVKGWPGMPQFIGLETDPGLGEWSTVKVPDAHRVPAFSSYATELLPG